MPKRKTALVVFKLRITHYLTQLHNKARRLPKAFSAMLSSVLPLYQLVYAR